MLKHNDAIDRRSVFKTTVLGLMGFTLPNVALPNHRRESLDSLLDKPIKANSSFPYIDPEIVSEVVGKSHFDLERVRELVDARPELARATWDWRFGDWESAIGAASHVGRRDITLYLLEKGARPSLFTYTMLGAYETVKSIIEFSPGIQTTMGPHGISLLSHAHAGERMKDTMNPRQIDDLKRTIGYLEDLGDADGIQYPKLSEAEQEKFVGDYRYGDGPKDGFTIQINTTKMISLGGLGEFGGALYKIGEHRFTYNGTPSVEISFDIQNDKVLALTVHEPGLALTAKKIFT